MPKKDVALLPRTLQNKITLEWIIDLNEKAKSIKHLEEIIEVHLHDLGLGMTS